MFLDVETRPGLHGDKEPVAFMLGDKRIEVVEILDRWIGGDHSYFKIQTSDQATYILRFEPLLNRWQLTLFKAHF
ncbi:hypothetical protein [Noviherbaspirillum autotrophicum]|uniref:Uncharacterized protein n=1 Tax=Noviherbaspirillum autotrophicum TaxID=709839 RepID=A0A0C1YM62_9BURK|nr:hypothetical protein [Noviherbaspirillum autotrophicum]KIF81597.1 hypothetical protein TSA66_13545 [Noviherbaspirillum autotrophicum]